LTADDYLDAVEQLSLTGVTTSEKTIYGRLVPLPLSYKANMFIDLHQDFAAYFYAYLEPTTISFEDFKKLPDNELEDRKQQVSLRSLQKFDTRLIVAACFPLAKVDNEWTSKGGNERLRKQFEVYKKLEKSGHGFEVVRSQKQFNNLSQNSRAPIGLILSLEGCDSLNSARDAYGYLRQDVKIFGLTWNLKNKFAGGLWTSCGLTKEGKKFVNIVDEGGGAIDLVHLHPKGVQDVLSLAPRKLLVSHTALSAYSRHTQNLTFKTIEQIIARDGLIGFGFLRTFFSLKKRGWAKIATIEKLAMELDVFKTKFGYEHCAIGSDFGGYPYRAGVMGIQNILGLATLKKLLKEKGWNKKELDSLFYGNAKRFLSELF
jgi:microsomal dipeptidase-like Zn-dependent dipeptidase